MKFNNKGVTMMLLVVTIILMIIIAFLAVFYSQNVAPEARIASAYSSLNTVRETCKGITLLYNSTNDEYYYFGKNIKLEHTDSEVADYAERCGVSSFDGDRVYLINPFSDKEEDKRRIKNLELSNLSEEFIVDLDNDKYYIVDGVSRNNSTNDVKYEYKDIKVLYDMVKSYGTD